MPTTPNTAAGRRPADAMPGPLADLDAHRVVDLDVRDDLRRGREPFSRIMEARAGLEPGQVLRLRAIFEPAPLYRVLGRQGFAHWTETLAPDDWRVWFYRPEELGTEAPAASPLPPPEEGGREAGEASGSTDAGVVVLDVRGLEPPEPLVRTLEALETLPEGGTLVQVNVREPRFLFPRLEERGFTWEVRRQDDDVVRVLIRRNERNDTR